MGVRGCQNLSIWDIAAELKRLHQLGIEGSLPIEDIENATISFSNIGSLGGTYVSPVVVPPQVAIGACGRIRRLPRFVGNTDKVVPREVMEVSWAADHRVVDGAEVAKFMN